MSEELLQTLPQQIGKYTYYRLGATTLDQLKTSGILPVTDYAALSKKKPDGLLLHHKAVKAVVEYKQPKELDTEKKIEKAIKQELLVAQKLCKMLIVTDGSKSIWINALSGDRVVDVSGNPISTVFHPSQIKNIAAMESLIAQIDGSLTLSNSVVKNTKLVDPTPLASRLWQTIWVATGKSPIKCLYNVVELFIFKFLSDLEILDKDTAFHKVYQKSQSNSDDALDYYARNTRPRIHKLFPAGKDGTTIINGTIFVNEKGEANLTQALLFRRSLEHLNAYGEDFGSLTKIDKQFKTKLYETFLQQEVEALGQYFTPRSIIQSVIRMAGLDRDTFQYQGKRICDPFCGVGGFPLELLNMNENMASEYTPDDQCKIKLSFTLNGFDKGFERDDERTIILAKANMLIYLAETLFKYPNCSQQFAGVFNDTFKLFRDNLGTFGWIPKPDERFHLILSNPPYVTSGTSIIKEQIRTTEHTKTEYPINALGLEGLSMEWIIRSLHPGGKSFLIIPDGILARVGGKKLRDYLLQECTLDAVVSLPIRTFFSNSERTYILAITKKQSGKFAQIQPVFTYFVSEIGERLTSVKREEIDQNDLPEMERLFRVYSGSPQDSAKILQAASIRCKIQPIALFQSSSHWVVDRWWSRDERIKAGIDIEQSVTDSKTIDSLIEDLREANRAYHALIKEVIEPSGSELNVTLGSTTQFSLSIGKRILRRHVSAEPDGVKTIPAYSSNVSSPFGYVETSIISKFEKPSIIWGIDGNFEFALIGAGIPFTITDHCGRIEINDDLLNPEFVLAALSAAKLDNSFDRSFRASLSNMRQFVIAVPADAAGLPDLSKQHAIAVEFEKVRTRRAAVSDLMEKVREAVLANLG